MSLSMNHSYFKEPNEINKTLKGFSVGDNFAARGSKIILRIFELTIFNKLQDHKLHKNVNRYLRFCDDVSLHVTGNTETMLKIVKIITIGYPEAIRFNVKTKIIYGKLLNIKIFYNPATTKQVTTVLRKYNSKYDVIPFNSTVNPKYKKMAGLCHFKTNRTHTTSEEELSRQNQIITSILKEKGFPLKFIKNLVKIPKDSESLIQNTSTQNYCNFTSTINQEFQANKYETITRSLMEPTLNPGNDFAQENKDPQSYISSARKKKVLNEISLENLQPFGKSSSLLLSSFPVNNRRNSVISVGSSMLVPCVLNILGQLYDSILKVFCWKPILQVKVKGLRYSKRYLRCHIY